MDLLFSLFSAVYFASSGICAYDMNDDENSYFFKRGFLGGTVSYRRAQWAGY